MSVTPRGPDRRLTELTIVLPASPPPPRSLKRFASDEHLLDGHVVLKASRSCNSLFPTEDMSSSWGQLFSRGAPADAATRASLGVDLNAACAPLLYVFDFDQTILRIHSYGSRIRAEGRKTGTAPQDVAGRDLDSDVADVAFFKSFIAATQEARVPVAVASFGEYEVIQNYMDRLTPGVFTRENICTPSCVGYSDGCSVPQGKNSMLEQLATKLVCGDGQPLTTAIRERVVLFDDDPNNITKCSQLGYLGCHSPDAFSAATWPSFREELPRGCHTS